MLKQFSYQFIAGPFPTREELQGDWQIGNCRRALQYYVLQSKGLFLKPDEVLSPGAYHKTGTFVFKKGEKIDLGALKTGDIIYAERIRSKAGELVDKSEQGFPTEDDYITSLHTAIWIGEPGKEIWHSTAVEGSSCSWVLGRFQYFYRIVAAKRITT